MKASLIEMEGKKTRVLKRCQLKHQNIGVLSAGVFPLQNLPPGVAAF